jgi:hypothetical protein
MMPWMPGWKMEKSAQGRSGDPYSIRIALLVASTRNRLYDTSDWYQVVQGMDSVQAKPDRL